MDWQKLYEVGTEINTSSWSMYDELKELDFSERYVKKEFVNQGSMKQIFKCEDLSTGRIVAYASPLSNEPLFIESFLREAKITASLQHPNIIPIYDIGIYHGECFFTMKMIHGKSLAEILFDNRSGYNLNDLIPSFLKICDAVSYAHSRGVIHLDLKPSNIQVSDHGEVILTDWGLARIVDWDNDNRELLLEDDAFNKADVMQNTLFGHIKGTPGFLSPEQAKGVRSHKSYSSDIYSLGAILYSILCRKVPFDDLKLEEVISNTLKGNFKAPSTDNSNISSSLEAICLKAMALRPEDRYNSVDELIADLQRYQNGYAPLAEKPTFYKQLIFSIRRRPLLFIVLLIFTTVIGIGSTFFNISFRQKQREAEQNLLNYQKIQSDLQKFSSMAAKQYHLHASKFFSKFDYESALKDCEMALNLKPNLERALRLYAKLAFIKLDLELIKQIQQRPGGHNSLPANIVIALENYLSHIAIHPEQRPQQFAKLHRIVDSYEPRISRMLIIDYMSDEKNGIERIETVRFLTPVFNPKLSAINLDYQYRDGYFELNFSNNQGLSNLSALWGLPIKKLNLTNCSITGLNGFRGNKIESLNISNNPLKNFKELNFPVLNELVIKNVSLKQLNFLRDLPVKRLNLSGTILKNFYFLSSLPEIKEVIVDYSPRNYPAEYKNIFSPSE